MSNDIYLCWSDMPCHQLMEPLISSSINHLADSSRRSLMNFTKTWKLIKLNGTIWNHGWYFCGCPMLMIWTQKKPRLYQKISPNPHKFYMLLLNHKAMSRTYLVNTWNITPSRSNDRIHSIMWVIGLQNMVHIRQVISLQNMVSYLGTWDLENNKELNHIIIQMLTCTCKNRNIINTP